ncbi:MAG: GNAT family N-acetyltransferase [Desulfitobacteriia bacterium]|jgi:RimJ/RimL family protein N-acetyltransferase
MLIGKLTTIRPLEIEDLENLYIWYNNPEYSYWVSGNWPLTTMLRREEIERKFYEEDTYRYAITTSDGQIIGTIGFDQVNIPARSARIYIGIGSPDYWGKGYGFEALTIFINYLFGQWNFNRLTAETWSENHRALSCYQKIGFQVEGRLREAYYVNSKYYDALILGLLKREFYHQFKF